MGRSTCISLTQRTIKCLVIFEYQVLGGRNGEGRSGRLSRWDRIAFAAMKQCLRSHALEVHDPCTVETLTDMIQRNQNSFLGATGAPPFGQTLLALEPSMRER